MDPRETPFDGQVAHVSLKGKVEAARFVEGEVHHLQAITAPIRAAPSGPRERELLLGEAFRVIDADGAWAFGFAERDGYVGWIETATLVATNPKPPTHRVCASRTYGKGRPELKSTEPVTYLPFGACVHVAEFSKDWARVPWRDCLAPQSLFLPATHLKPLGHQFESPVAVARLFLGTPYLWGGNSAFGIDCSGLIQAAMLACGVPCPGDSDQQRVRLGEEIAENAERLPADLYFWEGHVGMLVDAEMLIHANAHDMAVAEEPLEQAIARIAATEGKPVLMRRRVDLPS